MSNDRIREFLSSIRAKPEDDDSRLVVADLYEESGELDRANLIRLQIERARLERWDPKCVHLELKERVLLEKSGEQWTAELPQHEGIQWGRFSRGFMQTVAFDDITVLAEHGAACAEATPIEGVFIRWPRLDARPELEPIEGLREVTVVGTLMQPDDVEWLANSPLLSTVRTLNLVETQMTTDGLRALLASPHLEHLEALRMPLHDFGNSGVELLVDAEMPALVDLDISVASLDELGSGGRHQPTIDENGAFNLSTWPVLGQLRSLNLTGNQLGRDGLVALLSSPLATGLKTLGLKSISDWDWEGDGGRPSVLPALEHAVSGMQLDELDLGESEIDAALAPILADAPALAQLKILRMDYVQADDSLAVLAGAPWFDSLRIVSANDCSGAKLLKTFVARGPKNLHTLSVASTYHWSRLEDVAETLTGPLALEALLILDLGPCNLKAGAGAKLGEVDSLPNLVSLSLGDEYDETLTEEDAAALAASPLGERLLSLRTGHADRLPPREPIAVGRGEYSGPLRYL